MLVSLSPSLISKPFNEVIRPSHRLTVSNSDVYNDVTKSVQLLLSGAPLFLFSKTPDGYSNSFMATEFSKPTVKILALDEHNNKYFIVDGILYDLVLGKGKTPSRIETDHQVLSYITGTSECPNIDPGLREKVEELRTEYVAKINELKGKARQY